MFFFFFFNFCSLITIIRNRQLCLGHIKNWFKLKHMTPENSKKEEDSFSWQPFPWHRNMSTHELIHAGEDHKCLNTWIFEIYHCHWLMVVSDCILKCWSCWPTLRWKYVQARFNLSSMTSVMVMVCILFPPLWWCCKWSVSFDFSASISFANLVS